MPRSGEATRQNILDAAQNLVLRHGLAGASIDRIISAADITKGAFFHHFPNKAALAEAVIARFIKAEAELFASICGQAERLSDDSVQRLLNIIGLYADALDDHPEVVNGCLYASVAMQRSEFPDNAISIATGSIDDATRMLRPYYEAAIAASPPRKDVDVDDLVDMFVTVGEGAMIMAGLRQDPSVPGKQFRVLKTQMEAIFGR
ncbi:MAG: TetR/AcrR family transcriptional regulator [Rhodospirillales bacterium]|nr:TetR/AcrR family transcriptional regulator [Rhodospirillales bacterium]MBO6785673.1 TetR/AcrR family transcriptional regulator [Rhodospirillales bacterium]